MPFSDPRYRKSMFADLLLTISRVVMGNCA